MDDPRPIEPPGSGDEHRMPRWVKGFIILAVAVLLLAVAALVIGNGGHGPSRHLPGGDEGTTQAAAKHSSPFDH